jgi:multiple sugar transport system ATP-binding protein
MITDLAHNGITLTGIERRFGSTVALAGVDLRLPTGSLTVIVGPSGCGKSTLLRILAGLDVPAAGRIMINGEDVTDHPAGRRDLALVFQDYALFPHLTVERNISFGLRLERRHHRGTGPTLDQIRARTAEVAALLGLESLLHRKPGQLSGGQRQRVALARAIIRRPGVLLLDEPLSALDVALRAQARAEILRLHRELGATLVLVTHDQHEALSMATHLVVMDRGRVVQNGDPAEIYGRPASVFVAGFVGSPRMNLWRNGEGTVGWRPGDARLITEPVAFGTGTPAGPGPDGAGLNVVGTVEFCEFGGTHQELRCRGESGPFTLVQREGETWLRPGDPVRALVPHRSVHHFDADGRASPTCQN